MQTDDVHSIALRMALVEAEVRGLAAIKRWVIMGVLAMLAQAGGFVYGYAQMSLKVEQLASKEDGKRIVQLNSIVADHSQELESARLEQARIRERVDIISDRKFNLFNKLDERVGRLEGKVYK